MNPTPAQSSDVKFEIGHVLFVDIVGYSKLLINEQSEQIQKLNQIVSATKQFRLAEAEDKLLRLPPGDGGALIFRTSPEAPALCALDTARRARGRISQSGWHRELLEHVLDGPRKAGLEVAPEKLPEPMEIRRNQT